MRTLMIVIGLCAGLLAIAMIFAIWVENSRFNKGTCPVCGKKLYLVGRDSHGSRYYECDESHYGVWISYPCVDKEGRDG